MEYKVIYLSINGRDEQAEFRCDEKGEDMREVFRAAGQAGQWDLVKLYNAQGNLLAISGRTPPNTPDTRYLLYVVSHSVRADYTMIHVYYMFTVHADRLHYDPCVHFDESLPPYFSYVLETLQKLEKSLPKGDHSQCPALKRLHAKMDSLTQRLEVTPHSSSSGCWLGLFKNMKDMRPSHCLRTLKGQQTMLSADQNHLVYDKFMAMTKVQLSSEVREELRKTRFDNWQWDFPEMLVLLRQMFIDLRLIYTFNIQMPVLQNWLFAVFSKYKHVPFHNFEHAFTVSQMMYGLMWLIDLPSKLDPLDILTLMVSAICHDIDHPGYSNTYQVNARTPLALLYNDISPLENHHCAVTFRLLETDHNNILHNLTPPQFRRVREGIISCILGTDMTKHNEHVAAFKAIVPQFDFSNREHTTKLMIILTKAADISNECRPMEVSQLWLDCLLQEFFTQGDTEKLEGLPVDRNMDRDRVTKSSSQIIFIKVVLLPLFLALAELFPQVKDDVVQPAHRALQYYVDLKAASQAKDKDGHMGNGREDSSDVDKTDNWL
ncbi:high affinity cGMP-specific 3',5'-cyclic phosphodiesterase 9A-like [Babylonia areolata]|uniref:high affinity cGMP-specific 3',5'-cyclic phosphodiesterase 9A-like n=1 Tax=Babylonia areolata TaxID=304850 RepID=UPI003FD1D5F8